MALYNRVLAYAYARKYAQNYNDFWPVDPVSDCTNFISQALLSGGWQMVGGPLDDDEDAWYGTATPAVFPFTEGRSILYRSHSWGGAEPFAQFLRASGRATPCVQADLIIGDVVQLLDQKGRAHHSMIVTGGFGAKSVLSYHTKDRLDIPVASIIPTGYTQVTYWKLKDVVPDVPEPAPMFPPGWNA